MGLAAGKRSITNRNFASRSRGMYKADGTMPRGGSITLYIGADKKYIYYLQGSVLPIWILDILFFLEAPARGTRGGLTFHRSDVTPLHG